MTLRAEHARPLHSLEQKWSAVDSTRLAFTLMSFCFKRELHGGGENLPIQLSPNSRMHSVPDTMSVPAHSGPQLRPTVRGGVLRRSMSHSLRWLKRHQGSASLDLVSSGLVEAALCHLVALQCFPEKRTKLRDKDLIMSTESDSGQNLTRGCYGRLCMLRV